MRTLIYSPNFLFHSQLCSTVELSPSISGDLWYHHTSYNYRSNSLLEMEEHHLFTTIDILLTMEWICFVFAWCTNSDHKQPHKRFSCILFPLCIHALAVAEALPNGKAYIWLRFWLATTQWFCKRPRAVLITSAITLPSWLCFIPWYAWNSAYTHSS